MLSENTPLAPLPVTNRNTTPSKIIRIGGITTPTQNLSPLTAGNRPTSNPSSGNRPSSNSRSSGVNVVRLVQKNFKDEELTSKLTERAPSRSSSRRKQRRWENMNLFGIHEILSSRTSGAAGAKGSEEDEEEYFNQYLFPVDVHNKPSAFHELFLHKELLSIFRHCEEDLSFSSAARSAGSHHPLRTLEDKAWLNIEKKIRTILLKTVSENIKHFQFLFLIEKLLFSFIKGQLIPFDSVASSSTASTTSSMNLIKSYQLIEDKTGKELLKIELTESSFYRLLFHGICQFYNLKSQSYLIKNSTNKYIQVNKPKKLSLIVEKGLSLTKYLYLMIISSSSSVGDDDKKEKYEECMKEKENQKSIDVNDLISEFKDVNVKDKVSGFVSVDDVCPEIPSILEDDISARNEAPSVNSDGSDVSDGGYIIIDEQ
jgi:hypothetical protein